MLAHTRTESEFVAGKVPMLGRTKALNRNYFCPNSSCLADEVAVRSASSYANVWLVTDEEIGHSWLMMADKPSCPHCGSALLSSHQERAEVVLPLM